MLPKHTNYQHAHTNAHQMLDALRELTRVIASVHISIEENGKVFILSFLHLPSTTPLYSSLVPTLSHSTFLSTLPRYPVPLPIARD